MNKIKLFIILLLVAVFNFNGIAQGQVNTPNEDAPEALSIIDKQFFIENKGQWPSEVIYLTQMGGLNTWITTKGMMYEFYKFEEIKSTATTDDMPDKFEQIEYKKWGHRVGYKLLGNNVLVNTQGEQKQEGYYNYLIGNDPSKHASNVGLYKEAMVKEVYTGIDMRYYFDKGLLRYDYIVHPGADPRQIRFSLEGSDKTYLNEKGELVFTTCFGEVKNADLYCYQEQDKKSVDAHFTKQGESWTITLDAYNKNQTLIIDPLIYSTYIGGSLMDVGNSIAIDTSGNAYITGQAESTNYDITVGAFQTTVVGAGFADVFVTKLNASGTALIYSTFIGGSDLDVGKSIALDASGYAYITGYTRSSNFDITLGAFQTTYAGTYDVFVTKLNATGTALIYSTFIGGGGEDRGYSIALDASGNAYITGSTASTNYDITAGAFQTTYEWGNADVFVTKLNATGTALIYSTYIGGNDDDQVRSIALDTSGYAYITGYTNSSNYDITAGAFQTAKDGVADVFVTKLNATGTALIYSTFIGGGLYDFGNSITLDATGNAYITGNTRSTNYPITTSAFQTIYAGGTLDVFVTKLNATGAALIYSTYIGGNSEDESNSITLDATGNAYITGSTYSSNYDITVGAFQTTIAGVIDVFVTKLNATGTALIYSTFIGGGVVDRGYSIALDAMGNAYITGYTKSTEYDTTTGVFQTTNAGNEDVFVTKLCMFAPSSIILSSAPSTTNQTLCVNTAIANISYTTTGGTDVTFSGLPTGVTGNWAANVATISGTATTSGTFNYTINLGCETKTGTIMVLPLSTNTDIIAACDSITWIDGNIYFVSTNTPTYILTNTVGCDSVITLILTINATSSTDVVTACDSITWLDGITYTANTNTPTFTLTNAAGCDSVVTLNLTINNATTSTDTQTACNSYLWIDGNTYTTNNNTALFTLANSGGCDSVVTLNLTINNSSTSTDVQTACNTYTWIDGNTYTTSTNTPTFTLTNSTGCDSVVTLNLTINNIDTSITQNINILTASETGATYQWLDCNNGNAIITGETNQSYIPASSGNYAVVVFKNGCTDTSACINFIITGISDLETPFVKISPNPTTAEFIIELTNFSPKTQLKIVNVEGKTVYTNNTINTNKIVIHTTDWSKGIYMVKITDKQSSKVIKLIKQ